VKASPNLRSVCHASGQPESNTGLSLNSETEMVQNRAENLKSLPQIGAG